MINNEKNYLSIYNDNILDSHIHISQNILYLLCSKCLPVHSHIIARELRVLVLCWVLETLGLLDGWILSLTSHWTFYQMAIFTIDMKNYSFLCAFWHVINNEDKLLCTIVIFHFIKLANSEMSMIFFPSVINLLFWKLLKLLNNKYLIILI